MLLCKQEEKFISYLQKKNILVLPADQYNKDIIGEERVDNIYKELIKINTSDAWIYDKAKQSFVSYIRFYTEIDLKYIFDIKQLDIGSVASSFSLLKVPRVKEILGKKIDFIPITDDNPNELEYKDANTKKQMEEKKV